jgi:hypothetical protein
MSDDKQSSPVATSSKYEDWGKPKFEIVITIEDNKGRSEQEILEGIMPALLNAGFFHSEDRYDFMRSGNTVVISKAYDYFDIWDNEIVH